MPPLTIMDVRSLLEMDGFGIGSFCRAIQDDDSAFDFVRHSKIINLADETVCRTCGKIMRLVEKTRQKCRYDWICDRPCRNHATVSSGTLLEHAKLSYVKVLELILNWYFHIPVTKAAGTVGVSKETACHWYQLCRDVCHAVVTKENIAIGGPGLHVVIDESHVCRRKYHRGRLLASEAVWIFGGICR
jgi:hypothetical protein